ncbi:MAG TPA: hypothetical protein DCX32_00080 [Candidatus Moranbacteria bacterium]|nr:MAG: hypothetical protein UW95_C0015G0004 [Parcubacteria group bacterium GW2011_GWC1_45_14]HAV10935.1 hypothetical protein [Candidatus Moranbacteria bacterium]
MDNKTKAISIAIGIAIIILTAIFIFSISSYNVPEKKSEKNEEILNSRTQADASSEESKIARDFESGAIRVEESVGSTGGSGKEKILQEQENMELAKRLVQKETAIGGSMVEVLVQVESQSGLRVPGINCRMDSVLPNGQRETMFSMISDSKGECLFYSLDGGKKYEVVLFAPSTAANRPDALVGMVSTGNTKKGTLYTQLVVISSTVAVSALDEKITDETGRVACVDSDGEVDIYEKDRVTGMEPPAYADGSGKGNILGLNENNCFSGTKSSENGSVYNDCCANDNAINEAFCNADGYVAYTTISCPKGCHEGVCLK